MNDLLGIGKIMMCLKYEHHCLNLNSWLLPLQCIDHAVAEDIVPLEVCTSAVSHNGAHTIKVRYSSAFTDMKGHVKMQHKLSFIKTFCFRV